MNKEKKQAELMGFITVLKQNGFRVFAPEDRLYCFFVLGNDIGYVECGAFGFNFSTVHKPNRSTGTGFSVARDCSPSLDKARECFIFAPAWASRRDQTSVIKYRNWAEYISYPVNNIVKTYEI